MKNKNLILGVVIIVVVVGGIFWINYFKNGDREKYYDWNIRFIVCNECSPYTPETISLLELKELKNILINKFEKDEVIFDSFGTNSFLVNITNEANDKLNDIIKDINFNDLINLTITTVYYNRIIRQEEQKEPLNEEEIYMCEEDRECIKVGAGCCGCNSGGQATTINEDYSNYWTNKLVESCEGTGCLAVMSNHWTCFAELKCINNKCELIKS